MDIIEKYKSSIPEKLIKLWEEDGFSVYKDGLFKTVNPDDFEYVVEEWKSIQELFTLNFTSVHIIGYTSFGNLIIWVYKENEDSYLAMLDILHNKYEILVDDDFDFFWDVLLNDTGFLKKFFDVELFQQVMQKCGIVEKDECYGFVPLPALGGTKDVKLAEKVKLKEYLTICFQTFG